MLPAWRPDKANEYWKNRKYPEYMKKLSQVSGVEIADFADLKEALLKRMEFFAQMGCSVSDHALEYVMYAPAAEEKVNEIFKKRLKWRKHFKRRRNDLQDSFLCSLLEKNIIKRTG